MLPMRANFSNKYKSDSLECQACVRTNKQTNNTMTGFKAPIESQFHILTSCPNYSDLRILYDTETDKGLVDFVKAVLDRRIEEGDQ